jgi:hypothetical protein
MLSGNLVVKQDNVVALPVKPKTMQRTYKGAKITLTFIVGKRVWKWRVEIQQTVAFEDEAATDVKALRAAEKFIDKVKKDG